MTALCLKETLVGLFMYLHIVNQHKIYVKTQQKKTPQISNLFATKIHFTSIV